MNKDKYINIFLVRNYTSWKTMERLQSTEGRNLEFCAQEKYLSSDGKIIFQSKLKWRDFMVSRPALQ